VRERIPHTPETRRLLIGLLRFSVCLLAAFLIVVAVVMCGGCASTQKSFQPHCVPISIFRAWTAAHHGYPTRIAVSNVRPGVDHAQAEALINGRWTPLTVTWDTRKGVMVTTWTRHFGEPYRTPGLDEFIAEQKGHRHP